MLSQTFEISGTIRNSHGKGSSRQLRKLGKIPGVLYGMGRPTLNIEIDPKKMTKMLLTPLRRNIVINLNIDNFSNRKVMVRDLQIDPIHRGLIHIDFIEIDPKIPIKVSVPLNIFGKSEAIIAGGQLEQIYHKIPIKVIPEKIPVSISLDISSIGFGSTAASQLKLPVGIELAIDLNKPIVSIKMPKIEKDESLKSANATNSNGPATT